MSGITTATVIAGVGAVASVASAAYALTSKGATASGAAASNQVSASQNQALQSRSALLETAGGSAGSPLAPGQVAGSSNTTFGN